MDLRIPKKPHILMFPFTAQGHMIPMIDIAKLMAQQGASITIVMTRNNALRFKSSLSHSSEINLIELDFPHLKAGLPEGCENLDAIPSPDLIRNLFDGISIMLENSMEVFETLSPSPDCVVSDMFIPWTINVARRLGVPRISFNGMSCFSIFTLFYNPALNEVRDSVKSDTEYFTIPDLPDRVEITRAQLPGALGPNLMEFYGQFIEAEAGSYGNIVNSFEELEPEYAKRYKEEKQGRVWCVGPASLCNKEPSDKVERGNKSVVGEREVLEWLDSKKPSSVIYICLGSLNKISIEQLAELGFGLEASNKPFMWVIGGRKGVNEPQGLEEWISKVGFESRVEGRGFLIRGWAPQVLILSHPSVGGFLTHCGWNSTLEGICAGIPLVAWPMFSDQFLNEKLATQVLKVAVSLGVEEPMKWGEEEKNGAKVRRETIKDAIESPMDEVDEESRERRERARKLGEIAKLAVEEGGSSYKNIALLLQDVTSQRPRD